MISKLSAIANLLRPEAKYIRHLETRAMRAEAELAEAQRNYLSACRLVAEMHEAATGRVGEAPEHGVVDDVRRVRAERDVAIALLREARSKTPVAGISFVDWGERVDALLDQRLVTHAEMERPR